MKGLGPFQLEAARLHDMDCLVGRVVDLRAQRVADVAADEHVVAAGREHPSRQRRRRRLPFRAGVRDDAAAEPAPGALQLSHAGHARGARVHDRGLARRDTGAEHDQVRVAQRLRTMAAELQLHAGGAQLSFFVDPLADVHERHARAATHQQLRRGDAAPRGPHHHDPLAQDRERSVRSHLSLRVVRLKSAKMIARMTNRAMTFGSLQPMSSKWWCSGAMRKTRLPVSLNDATWITTDAASSTKTPPTMTRTNSCLMRSAIVPSAPPRAREPTSPMKISAGYVLYQ